MAYDQDKLLEIIGDEYDRASKFIDNITSTSATIRGLGVTIWLAVLSVAFDRSLWELGALAAATAGVFWIVDGYHAWLYGEAFSEANDLERIQGLAYNLNGRLAGNARAARDLKAQLQAHEFGLYRNFKRFGPRDLLHIGPYVFFRIFYPFLVLIGIAAALFIGLRSTSAQPVCKPVPATQSRAIQCGDVVIVGGRITTTHP